MDHGLKTRLKKISEYIFHDNRAVTLCFLLIAVTGALVYRNASGGPFIFDDVTQIVLNPKVQTLEWPWRFLENNRRPVLYATLAIDFHGHAFDPLGFHATNIRIHILAGIFLFLLIYTTCRYPKMPKDIRQDAALLALGASLIWLCHPIQTQAVTYIIQRAESLMGLFFLMTLFFCAQYLTSRRIFWLIIAGATSLLCGLTKEVALALPLVVLLYDRAFISPSFREALKNNRYLYLGLSLTWAVMFYLYFTTRPEETLSAGFGMQEMTPWLYAINQPKVILHYLRLIVFPAPLIFYYDWRPVEDLVQLLPSVLIFLAVVSGFFAAFIRSRAIGFLGLSFFLILAPSSSFIPVKDLIYEYRAYLPLACIAVLFVLGVYFLIQRCVSPKKRTAAFVITMGSVALMLGGVAYQRNKVYSSEETMWKDVIAKCPHHARAYNNLASVQLQEGRTEEARQSFLKSIEVDGSYPEVYANVSVLLLDEGKFDEALEYSNKALAIDPDFAIAHYNIGLILSRSGKYKDAISYFEKSLQLGLVRPAVLKNLGVALAKTGQTVEALKVLQEAARLDPGSREIQKTLQAVAATLQKKKISGF